MSEYTRGEILKRIEENGGPEGLDLSGKDLSGIDLSREAIEVELAKVRETSPGETPVWYSERTSGMNLEGANLEWANLTDANLRGANLEDAILQEAILQGADLRGVRLQGAILRGAYLEGAIRDWQAIPVTEGMLEVAFAITGITSALIGVVAASPSFGGMPMLALLIPISLSAVASIKLYLSYLNQQGFHASLRQFALSPYGWLLLASAGAWLFAAFMVLKQILVPSQ